MTDTDDTDGQRREAIDPLLDVEGVYAGYDGTQVLRGLSFGVERGEVVSLVGRNGAGKTTTLRSVMGNVVPSEGTVTFDGEDVTDLEPEETARRGVSLVPEERRIFPGLTVRENLEIAQLGGADADDAVRLSIDEVFDMFENLARNEEAAGNALSGGEQQMLAISRALVGGASLLMLDEPTEGLAPYIVRRVEEVIEELNAEGLTVLLVEQNVQVALDAADYHYILDKGGIAYEGPSETLRENRDVLDRYLGVTA